MTPAEADRRLFGSPVDFVGREITVGATIVYPTRKGSEMWLSKGKVRNVQANSLTDAVPHTIQVEATTHKGDKRVVYIPSPRSVVVVAP